MLVCVCVYKHNLTIKAAFMLLLFRQKKTDEQNLCVLYMCSYARVAACAQIKRPAKLSVNRTWPPHGCISATFSKWTLKCSLPPPSSRGLERTRCSLLLPLPPPLLSYVSVHSCPPFLPLYASSNSKLLIVSKIWRCKLCDHSPNRPLLLTEGAPPKGRWCLTTLF